VLTHLRRSTEQTVPILMRLAGSGLFATSLDPPGHGQRTTATDLWQYTAGMLGSFAA
jgi:hypothetical protein